MLIRGLVQVIPQLLGLVGDLERGDGGHRGGGDKPLGGRGRCRGRARSGVQRTRDRPRLAVGGLGGGWAGAGVCPLVSLVWF